MEKLLVLFLKQTIDKDIKGLNRTYRCIHLAIFPECDGLCKDLYESTSTFWHVQSCHVQYLHNKIAFSFCSCSEEHFWEIGDCRVIIASSVLKEHCEFKSGNIFAKAF